MLADAPWFNLDEEPELNRPKKPPNPVNQYPYILLSFKWRKINTHLSLVSFEVLWCDPLIFPKRYQYEQQHRSQKPDRVCVGKTAITTKNDQRSRTWAQPNFSTSFEWSTEFNITSNLDRIASFLLIFCRIKPRCFRATFYTNSSEIVFA